MKTGVFITGTDTGVGKTLCSSILLAGLAAIEKANDAREAGGAGARFGYWKPVQTGSDDDTDAVNRLTAPACTFFARPTYQFTAPMAPSRAAELEGRKIAFGKFMDSWRAFRDLFWVVEGAGGLLVPLGERRFILDLAKALDLPLVLVASPRLGTINHILLTLNAAEASHVKVNGIVLSGDEDPGLEKFLLQETGVAAIARIPVLPKASASHVRRLGARWAEDGTARALCGRQCHERR